MKNNVQMKGSTTMKETKNVIEMLSMPKVKAGNSQEATIVSFKAVNDSKPHLVFELRFDNGAVGTAYFYAKGIAIALNRLRTQSEDYDAYNTDLAFLQSRVGKRVSVDVSRYQQYMNYMFSDANVVVVSDSDKEI